MVAAGTATAELLSLPVSSDNETMRRIAHLLSRSLAAEGISDDLIDILGDRPDLTPAVGGSKLDGRLIRLGLPLPRRQQLPKAAPPLSKEEAAPITDRFRRATTQLMQVVPHRVATYLRHSTIQLTSNTYTSLLRGADVANAGRAALLVPRARRSGEARTDAHASLTQSGVSQEGE